jgi:DNA-binding transcriptional ArsR family regulator
MRPAEDIFDAIASPVRRRIVRELARGPAPVHRLQAKFDITQQAISKHLRVLTGAGLAYAERRGQENVYHLLPAALVKVQTWLDSFWSEKLSTLKSIAEEEDT